MAEKAKEKTVKIDEDADKIISELARMTGESKSKVLSEIVKSIGAETKKLAEDEKKELELDKLLTIVKSGGEEKSVLSQLTEALATQKMLERFMEEKKETIDWDAFMKILLIKQATTPDITQILALDRLMSKRREDGESAKFWERYMQQQMQMQQNLITLLFGERIKRQEEKIEKLREETKEMIEKIDQRINTLQVMASQQPERSDITQQIKALIEFRDSLKEAVEKLGLAEKPVADEKGRINVARLLERGLKLGEKIIEKIPATPPQPKPVREIPVQPMPQVRQEQPQVVEQPKEKEVEFIVPEKAEIKESEVKESHEERGSGESEEVVVASSGERVESKEMAETGSEENTE